MTDAAPGSVDGMVLAVDDVEVARDALAARGVDVSEVFHDAGGVFYHAGTRDRLSGPDPQRRSYGSWASFADPDGNRWMLQEITTRLPGRVDTTDVATLAELLRETAEQHDGFEKAAPPHDWWGVVRGLPERVSADAHRSRLPAMPGSASSASGPGSRG